MNSWTKLMKKRNQLNEYGYFDNDTPWVIERWHDGIKEYPFGSRAGWVSLHSDRRKMYKYLSVALKILKKDRARYPSTTLRLRNICTEDIIMGDIV